MHSGTKNLWNRAWIFFNLPFHKLWAVFTKNEKQRPNFHEFVNQSDCFEEKILKHINKGHSYWLENWNSFFVKICCEQLIFRFPQPIKDEWKPIRNHICDLIGQKNRFSFFEIGLDTVITWAKYFLTPLSS